MESPGLAFGEPADRLRDIRVSLPRFAPLNTGYAGRTSAGDLSNCWRFCRAPSTILPIASSPAQRATSSRGSRI